jgi:signal peptidase I
MTNEDHNQTKPIKTYRPWVGVVLSFFISGASQFLAGDKLAGIGWFLIIGLLSLGGMFCLASPSIPGDLPAFILFAIAALLWIIMLVKSCRPIPRLRWISWVGLIFLFLILEACDFGVKKFIRPFKMPTASMSPTLEGNRKQSDGTEISGDRIFVEGYAYWFSKPQRGDVVVFKTTGISTSLPENEFYIKRIIGIPGDVLSIQSGRLLNHGQKITDPPALAKLAILNPPVGNQSFLVKATDTFVVSNNCFFVVGDNTTNSYDSRFFGAIPEANIIGKATKIYWPLDRAGKIQ